MKKIIIGIAIGIFVVIGIILCFMNIGIEIKIKERTYKSIGDNLYYTDELLDTKSHNDEGKILNYYNLISNYLEKEYPNVSIYISNFNYGNLGYYDMIFNGYQVVDGVILENIFFSLTIDNNEISEEIYFNYPALTFINQSIDLTNIISVNEVIENASNLAKKNINKMGEIEEIKGEYHLEYDGEALYYMFMLNHGSYIKIDAKTNNVIDTYFFDGIYY